MRKMFGERERERSEEGQRRNKGKKNEESVKKRWR